MLWKHVSTPFSFLSLIPYSKFVGLVVRTGNASLLLGLVDVCALLAEIELRVTTTRHSLQPDKGHEAGDCLISNAYASNAYAANNCLNK